MLSKDFSIIGVARREIPRRIRAQMTSAINEFGTQRSIRSVEGVEKRMYYCQGNLTTGDLREVENLLDESEKKHGTAGNALFISRCSRFTSGNPGAAQERGLVEEKDGTWRRVIIEKPFGHDLASSQVLNREISSSLAEKQVYRIDHYLGKETAQNILVFRMGNGMFEPVWNAGTLITFRSRWRSRLESRAVARSMSPPARSDVMQITCYVAALWHGSAHTFGERAQRKGELLEAMRILSPEAVARDTIRGSTGPASSTASRCPLPTGT